MNTRLLFEKLKLSVQKRAKLTNNKKSYAGWLARGYNNTPQISVIMESHNKSLQIMHVVEKLRKYPSIEIIVIDDGSDLEHTSRLAEKLTGGNEFLVRANDLYENVMYNKTLRFANAPYIALLQDDDDFNSLEWIDRGLNLMKEHTDMVILGGFGARDIHFDDENKTTCGKDFTFPSGTFCYAPTVNRAPMWINRELFFAHLHNIEFSYAPFQMDDYEMCLRAWVLGLKVGWYNADFHSLSPGGMRLWNSAFTEEQLRRNGPQLYNTYRAKIDEIRKLVDTANKEL